MQIRHQLTNLHGGLRLLQDPEPVLAPLRGLVVIDEVQRLPALFRPLPESQLHALSDALQRSRTS